MAPSICLHSSAQLPNLLSVGEPKTEAQLRHSDSNPPRAPASWSEARDVLQRLPLPSPAVCLSFSFLLPEYVSVPCA